MNEKLLTQKHATKWLIRDSFGDSMVWFIMHFYQKAPFFSWYANKSQLCCKKYFFSMLAPTVAVSFCGGWTVEVIRTYLYQLDCSYNACNASRSLGEYWLLKNIHQFVWKIPVPFTDFFFTGPIFLNNHTKIILLEFTLKKPIHFFKLFYLFWISLFVAPNLYSDHFCFLKGGFRWPTTGF